MSEIWHLILDHFLLNILKRLSWLERNIAAAILILTRLVIQKGLIKNNLYQSYDEKKIYVSLAKNCYSMKMDLLTNATVVDDAIRFVSSNNKSKEKLKQSSTSSSTDEASDDKEESNEPDYDEDEDQLEEEQEETTASSTTTNQIF